MVGVRHAAPVGAIDLTEWQADHVGGPDWYDVTDAAYGAAADGVTDDTTEINAAITAANAAGGGTVYLPGGPGTTYLCLSLALKSNVHLYSNGARLLKNGGSGATTILGAVGTLGTAVSLNANAVAGALTVTAATNPATLVAGDHVMIRTATYKYGTSGRNQELNRIASVSGSGPYTFTLANRLIAGYTTANTAEIVKATPVVDATVEGVTFDQAIATQGGHIHADLTYGLTVRNCKFLHANELGAFDVYQSAHGRFINNDIRDGQVADTETGHGIIIGESSHRFQISGNYLENYNQCAFSNNVRDLYFTHNMLVRPHYDGVNTHGTGCERIVIAYNIIDGSDQFGISLSGSDWAADNDLICSGNFVINSQSSGISAGGTSANPVNHAMISDNFVYGWNRSNGGNPFGIVAAYTHKSHITGNTLDGASIAFDQVGIRVQDSTDVRVGGNVVRDVAQGTGIEFYQTTRTTIEGNQMSNISSYNISSLAVGAASTIIKNNVSDDSSRQQNIAAGERWEQNVWGTTYERNSGTASVSTGGSIAHGLVTTPTKWGVMSTSSAGAYATGADGTNLTGVTITGGGSQTIKWWAEV